MIVKGATSTWPIIPELQFGDSTSRLNSDSESLDSSTAKVDKSHRSKVFMVTKIIISILITLVSLMFVALLICCILTKYIPNINIFGGLITTLLESGYVIIAIAIITSIPVLVSAYVLSDAIEETIGTLKHNKKANKQ